MCEVIVLSEKYKNELIKRINTYIFSTIMGAGFSVLLIFLFALLMYAVQFPLYTAGYFSLLALGCGAMLSGFICGRIKQRGGLRLGFRCAVILLVLCGIGAAINGNFDGSSAAAKIFTAVICGCTGGVLGVNRRAA